MIFVKADELKKGMRLAKPIYNKNGVMLYERDSRLTEQGIISIQNFGLIGIYVLEPAEPVRLCQQKILSLNAIRRWQYLRSKRSWMQSANRNRLQS